MQNVFQLHSRDVAKALGLQTEGKSDEECAAYAIKEIETLSGNSRNS